MAPLTRSALKPQPEEASAAAGVAHQQAAAADQQQQGSLTRRRSAAAAAADLPGAAAVSRQLESDAIAGITHVTASSRDGAAAAAGAAGGDAAWTGAELHGDLERAVRQRPAPAAAAGGGRMAASKAAASTSGSGGFGGAHHQHRADPSPWEERWNMALLVLLYMMQGVPMGLTLGAMPFMLQSRLSYAQLGVFSIAAYPYSMKLFWSPIVDSCYSARVGRRKSWIIPCQLIIAGILVGCSHWLESLYDAADVTTLTSLFFVLVFLAATQDIAVDGWALTLLSPPNVSYASTCQTIGTSTGFFTSFTILLALMDPKFCNTYIRSSSLAQSVLGLAPQADEGLVTLGGYLRFWGAAFVLVTVAIWALKSEVNFSQEELEQQQKQRQQQAGGAAGGTLREVAAAYQQLWRVVKLPAVWALTALLLTYRLGIIAAEGGYSLRLMERGVAKEALAGVALVQFPVELGAAVIAGRWAANHSPFGPFIAGYFLRLTATAGLVGLALWLPGGEGAAPPGPSFFLALTATGLASSFVSTLAFTALGSFFNTISDPEMGGAYLTLLNTITNMGYILPKAPLFWLMDTLTTTRCMPPPGADAAGDASHLAGYACPKKLRDLAGVSECAAAGGACALASDGFATVAVGSLALGVLLGVVYARYLPRLMALPLERWRAAGGGDAAGDAAEAGRRKAGGEHLE